MPNDLPSRPPAQELSAQLRRILEIGRCPRTGQRFGYVDGDELVSIGGERYPIVGGKPILVREIEPMHTRPPEGEVISKNADEFYPIFELATDSVLLHLGCGDVPSRDPRVVSLDILPTGSADVVAEAEALPFQDASIDFVVSGAVFEHLHDPLAAAAEVRRVLKPGGRFYIDTAFMQAYHGFPSHYFNMTPQAVETFVVDDFIIEDSFVPDSATVLTSLTSLFDRFLELLPARDAKRLLGLPLGAALAELRADTSSRNPLVRELSLHAQRSMAASFVVIARKPDGHGSGPRWSAARRAYYTARNAAIFRHHEAELYRRLTRELGAEADLPAPRPIALLLHESRVANGAETAFVAMTDRLAGAETELLAIRNLWIGAYMDARARHDAY